MNNTDGTMISNLIDARISEGTGVGIQPGKWLIILNRAWTIENGYWPSYFIGDDVPADLTELNWTTHAFNSAGALEMLNLSLTREEFDHYTPILDATDLDFSTVMGSLGVSLRRLEDFTDAELSFLIGRELAVEITVSESSVLTVIAPDDLSDGLVRAIGVDRDQAVEFLLLISKNHTIDITAAHAGMDALIR